MRQSTRFRSVGLMTFWAHRGAIAGLACFGIHLSSYVGIFVFFPSDKVWIVVWSMVAVATVISIFMMHAPVAKFFFAMTLAPISAVIWVFVQFVNGTATEFYGLYIFEAGAFLFIFSVAGLVAGLAVRGPVDS